jgi:hypothetical protein
MYSPNMKTCGKAALCSSTYIHDAAKQGLASFHVERFISLGKIAIISMKNIIPLSSHRSTLGGRCREPCRVPLGPLKRGSVRESHN